LFSAVARIERSEIRERCCGLIAAPGLAALNLGYETNRRKRRMRNAVRRRLILRNSRCGAHPAGRARLPAFHRGSALGTRASQGATSDQVSRNGRPRWRGSPAGVRPGYSEHLAHRS